MTQTERDVPFVKPAVGTHDLQGEIQTQGRGPLCSDAWCPSTSPSPQGHTGCVVQPRSQTLRPEARAPRPSCTCKYCAPPAWRILMLLSRLNLP